MLMNTGDVPVYSDNGLVTTIAWGLDGKCNLFFILPVSYSKTCKTCCTHGSTFCTAWKYYRYINTDNGLVTTIAWGLDGKVTYALEGSIFIAGAAVQWMRDEMRLIQPVPALKSCLHLRLHLLLMQKALFLNLLLMAK